MEREPSQKPRKARERILGAIIHIHCYQKQHHIHHHKRRNHPWSPPLKRPELHFRRMGHSRIFFTKNPENFSGEFAWRLNESWVGTRKKWNLIKFVMIDYNVVNEIMNATVLLREKNGSPILIRNDERKIKKRAVSWIFGSLK